MRVVDPSVELKYTVDPTETLKHIEEVARTCYKSKDKITDNSHVSFIKRLVRRGHEAMLEHGSVTAKFIVDRGVSHELVRHRIASFAQESTRYCNYGNLGLTFIKPSSISDPMLIGLWTNAMHIASNAYLSLLNNGCSPQQARAVLPNSLATSLVITANLREWRTILKLRCALDAHPDMRHIMLQTLQKMYELFPPVFEDIYNQYFKDAEITDAGTPEETPPAVHTTAE